MKNGVDLVSRQKFPVLLRIFSWFFSVIFHPLFIPLYVTWFICFSHTRYFPGFDENSKWILMIRVAINMVVFPLLIVLLLKALGFIPSVFLKTQRDRIVPYITSGVFFFWMYLVFRNQNYIPQILTDFVFAVFLSSSLASIANVYFKISMHGIGCGGLLGFLMVLWATNTSHSMTIPLIFGFLITGLVLTSRLIVSDHSEKELYSGLMLGFICQIISAIL